MKIPEIKNVEDIDFTQVEKSVRDYIEVISIPGNIEDAETNYIFEEVMEAFFGKGYWKWHNSLS